MRKVIYYILIFFSLVTLGQKHPLSKSDSGVVYNSLKKYEYLIANKDIRSASGALNDVAFVYWNNNHYREAADYYERSLSLNEQVANENGVAMINNNLGMLYADLGEYDKSLYSFTKTLAARRASKEPIGVISALINISVVLNNLQNYSTSVEHLLEALDIARELYDKHQMRSVYGMLSETYEKMGKVEKSLQYFELYKTFHEEIQRETVKTVNKELAKEKIEKRLVQSEKAQKENELLRKELEILRQEQVIHSQDSITQELYDNLSKNQIVIQLLEKEKELSELESVAKEQKNEQLSRERSNLLIIIILIVIAVLTITALVLINLKRTKKYAISLNEKNLSIERQNIEVQKANELKDRLFSIIAHDLRSPISSLQGFFNAIDEFEVDEDLRLALAGVESQLTNSATLLDNLLVWSTSQIRNAEPKPETVSIKDLVDESFKLLDLQANKKNIELVNGVEESSALYTDRNMINIVIRNLIQNAVKFTPNGGIVRVGFSMEQGHSLISVTDTGIGMDQNKIEQLFDIRTNRSSEGTEKEKGSGLGLILCKELVEKINGFIEVSSQPGVGSVFKLKF